MLACDTFAHAARSAGFDVRALASLDPTLGHQEGEPTALAAIGSDGLVYGGFNPHFETQPWFLRRTGLDLAQPADADEFYASVC